MPASLISQIKPVCMNIDALHHWRRVSSVALQLPGAELSSSYGTPAVKVKKKLFARLKEDGHTLVVFSNERDTWMKCNSAIFFITDHYRNYPMLLINLELVSAKDLAALVLASWQITAPAQLQQKKKK